MASCPPLSSSSYLTTASRCRSAAAATAVALLFAAAAVASVAVFLPHAVPSDSRHMHGHLAIRTQQAVEGGEANITNNVVAAVPFTRSDAAVEVNSATPSSSTTTRTDVSSSSSDEHVAQPAALINFSQSSILRRQLQINLENNKGYKKNNNERMGPKKKKAPPQRQGGGAKKKKAPPPQRQGGGGAKKAKAAKAKRSPANTKKSNNGFAKNQNSNKRLAVWNQHQKERGYRPIHNPRKYRVGDGSSRSFGSLSYAGGSPWCGGRPTYWLGTYINVCSCACMGMHACNACVYVQL